MEKAYIDPNVHIRLTCCLLQNPSHSNEWDSCGQFDVILCDYMCSVKPNGENRTEHSVVWQWHTVTGFPLMLSLHIDIEFSKHSKQYHETETDEGNGWLIMLTGLIHLHVSPYTMNRYLDVL